MASQQTLMERIWSKVSKRGPDECWPWLGSVDQGGYPQMTIWVEGKTVCNKPHRLICAEAHGPLGDLKARHTCDYRRCCNPAHLLPGTTKQNGEDMKARGRGRKPGQHGSSYRDKIL